MTVDLDRLRRWGARHEYSSAPEGQISGDVEDLIADNAAMRAVVAAADKWRAADIFLLKCGQDGGVDVVFDGEPASAGDQFDAAFQALRDAVDEYRAHAAPAPDGGESN